MRSVLKRKLPLSLIAALELEATGRKCILHVDCDIAAVSRTVLVRIIAYPPDVIGNSKPKDERTADEIIADISFRAGLEVI